MGLFRYLLSFTQRFVGRLWLIFLFDLLRANHSRHQRCGFGARLASSTHLRERRGQPRLHVTVWLYHTQRAKGSNRDIHLRSQCRSERGLQVPRLEWRMESRVLSHRHLPRRSHLDFCQFLQRLRHLAVLRLLVGH